MALNLAFYLASWGMYRGSSFLLDKSYKIHIEPVKLIFSKDELWEGPLSSIELTAFGKELANVYGVGDKVRASNNGISGNMTDTLFTKILLGLTGNVIGLSLDNAIFWKVIKKKEENFKEINAIYDSLKG